MVSLRTGVVLICTLLGVFVHYSCQAFVVTPATTTNNKLTSRTQLSMAAVPELNEWKILKNGGVSGVVKGHPSADIDDGDTIETSPLQYPEKAMPRALVSTVSGSKYRLGSPFGLKTINGKVDKKAIKKYNLNGKSIGDYVLSGNPVRSTSGRSQIWTAYRTDNNGLPTGEPLAIKTSPNREKIRGEYENYKKVASGVFQGCFVKLLDYFPMAGDSQPFSTQSALVVERGEMNLKDYFKGKRQGLQGKALRDAASAGAECVQAVHSSRLVWTDMKAENFVVFEDNSASGGGIQIRGIDLESCCPVKENPIDYSPESCPPEFARELLKGDGPYFVLEYSYDIWSYGIMLYELATGKSPYGTGKSASQISKMLNRPGYEVDVSDIPDAKLRDLVSQCLQIDPKRRPSITKILLHPYFLTTGFGPFSF